MISWLRRSIYADPLHAGRHPSQVFLLLLCVVSGIPKLFGVTTAGSVEASLPGWLAVAWGGVLFGGSAAALVGSYWRGELVTALTVERAGLALVGAAAVMFAIVVVFAGGWQRLLQAVIIAGFGGTCLRRAFDIGQVMKTAIRIVKNGDSE
jgi:hypothetical protein